MGLSRPWSLFFKEEDGIRDGTVTGVQTCALPILGAPKIANLKWEAWLLEFHKKRQELGIGMRILFTSDCRAYGEKRKQFKKSYVRYLPKHVKSTNLIDIFNDVFLCVIIQEPQTIVIRDPSLAGSMRQYFDLLWKISND